MHAKIERSPYLSSIESLCIFVRKFRNQKFLDREFRSIRKIDSRVTCNFVLGCSDERQRGIKSSLLFSKGGRLRLIDRESSTLLMGEGGERDHRLVSDDFDGSKLMAGTSEEREISIRPRHVAFHPRMEVTRLHLWLIRVPRRRKRLTTAIN